MKLRELFFVFGPPRLLHSDNGREFVANVIIELKKLFPDLVFVRGRPRHPQSQGCIDSDSDFWKLVGQNGIDDEEDLPTPVAESDNEIVDNKRDDTINSANVIDSDVVKIIEKLSDDVVSVDFTITNTVDPNAPSNLNKNNLRDLIEEVELMLNGSDTDHHASSSNSRIQSAITTTTATNNDLLTPTSTPSRHDLIRKAATNSYLATANKKMKQYQDSINSLTEKFNLNDCVGVPIHTVDRTNTDAKYLPCLIVEKIEKDKNLMYKLACQYGKLENTFTIEHFVDLKSACPEELKQLVIHDLKDITIIEACKLYVCESTNAQWAFLARASGHVVLFTK
ncbi:unnamed protein product [Didymodactylos carnosus]|uniref:Integrase catalytic domain-containing protein n=2 Tax=Didymodactylos carnosus TaxID=1234261 RepID=A0A8S2HI53_9BILA|nr:unnamed protein product [Didymodactylos carnosus]CAF3650948.1 unnamed protein product [Didymodactylos carnosus]